MRAIVRYVQEFPVTLHHPKEEEHLFSRLRERTTSCNAELDELERQHERDRPARGRAGAAGRGAGRGRCARPRCARRARSRKRCARYASFLWDHLGREEGVILPAAQRHLLAEDWAAIDAAFAENRDPNFGGDTDKEYRQLFSRIVNRCRLIGERRAPAPSPPVKALRAAARHGRRTWFRAHPLPSPPCQEGGR